MSGKTLSELKFKDLYVQVDGSAVLGTPSRYNPSPGPDYNGYDNHQVPADWDEDLNQLRAVLARTEEPDFAVTHDGVRLRVAKYPTTGRAGPETWAAMRRFPSQLPKLEALGFQPDIYSAFQKIGQRVGLVVVGGATGAGKTTTIVAILRECMARYGGLTYTIEDPVEYMMAGPFEDNPANSFVLQREVKHENEWADAIKAALRSAPKYIFLGEVRTPDAARQLLRASNSGHLVFCTVHGGSLEQTLSALVQIAAVDLGPLASVLLADGLAMVVHQEIVSGRPQVRLIETRDNDNACPVRQNIRGGKLEMLSSTIQQQAARRGRESEAGLTGAPSRASSPGVNVQPTPVRRPVPKAPPPKPKSFWGKLFG